MPDFYYTKDPTSAHRKKEISLHGELSFKTDSGVFSRDHVDPGSLVLIGAVKETLSTFSGNALDLGCGYGPIGICLAKQYENASFLMTDVNNRALELCHENISANNVKNASVRASSGLDEVKENFDLIVSNPPIRIGKAALYSMWADCHTHLNAGGRLYLVIRKKQGSESAARYLKELFGNCETVERSGGYHVLMMIKEP